jgi:signal transduction histidine kinase
MQVDHGEAARSALRRLWEEMEARRASIDAHVELAAREVPTFAALIEAMPPEVRAQQQAHSIRTQREALLEGRWENYDGDLRAQGQVYAEMGIAFPDWYRLLGAFREALLGEMLPAQDVRLKEVLLGTNLFLDHAMSLLGEAYVDAKQAQVRKLETQLQLHIDLVQDAPLAMLIWHWDQPHDTTSFRVVARNPAAVRLGPAVPTAADADRWITCLRTRKPSSWISRSGDGVSARTLSCRCFALDEDYIGVLLEDVTEREALQEDLARHVQDLERSNRELDEFAYVASHDLKAPLQDVRNLAGWIVEDAGDRLPPSSARHMQLLCDRVRRMERLLDDLLDYSRSGRPDGTGEKVSLADVVADVTAFVGPPAGFAIDVHGEVPPLSSARAPLEQVIRNLVSNALKHHDRQEGRITISMRQAGDRAVVCVADDGPGIPPEFHERVFRMFQTLRSRDEVEGSGMGLTIVRKAVEARGGTVTLESSGRGTRISFTWPMCATGGA